MSAELVMKMRGRVEQCRRLARSVNDSRATEALLAMAVEIEADLKKLEAERAASRPEVQIPPPRQV